MPPTPSSFVMRYRFPNRWPTLSGPVSPWLGSEPPPTIVAPSSLPPRGAPTLVRPSPPPPGDGRAVVAAPRGSPDDRQAVVASSRAGTDDRLLIVIARLRTTTNERLLIVRIVTGQSSHVVGFARRVLASVRRRGPGYQSESPGSLETTTVGQSILAARRVMNDL